MRTFFLSVLLLSGICLLLRSSVEVVPHAAALPSYARQTGLPCSGCHYTPPELNPAGRLFKLMGYIDKMKDTSITAESGGRRSGLEMLATLPLSAWFERRSPALMRRKRERRMEISNFLRMSLCFLPGRGRRMSVVSYR